MFLVVTVHVELLDTIDRKLLMLECDLIGVGCKLVGIRNDLLGESGTEEDDLGGWGQESVQFISTSNYTTP